MKIYLVGGAVRDQLLKLPITERDWVVVESTPEEMLALGYKPVGKDFPVFLHPVTHEEYALARTERKIGKGYKGFKFYTDKSVTLEDDLRRRDLTINAIAKTPDGKIIDPYHGQKDLKNKILRHVSEAFAEDPVRILRVARFAARFKDFKVHPDTLLLMQEMVRSGEVDALVAERVWQEFERALGAKYPDRFFEILKDCKALPKLFPEIDANLGDVLAILKRVTTKVAAVIRFAAMLRALDLHEIKNFCDRLRVPNEYERLAILVAKYKTAYCELSNADSEGLLTLLEKLDAFRRPQQVLDFIAVCKICFPKVKKTAPERLLKAFEVAVKIKFSPVQIIKLTGIEIKQKIHSLRAATVKKLLHRKPRT